MPNKFLIFTFLLVILSFSATVLITEAADDDEEETAEEVSEEISETDYACVVAMIPVIETETANYEAALNEYFLFNEESSSQVLTAMEIYRAFESSLQEAFDAQFLTAGVQTFDVVEEEFIQCQEDLSNALKYGQLLLRAQVLQSANSKRSFEIVDSFKAINEDMEGLSENFHLTFPRTFEKMNNALPCYARQCVSK